MTHKIIGTAGHIDHGKSSLIKALTGTDPDRLAEEQERGMTIDLGFAFLNDEIAFIDVPGHEKFIKNMMAGASTIDAVLLVIAADDGVMPQTREHLDILKLLQIRHGIVALTKIDMVEDDWLDIVEEDVRDLLQNSFLGNAPIMRVSSTSGKGVAELRTALIELLQQVPSRQDRGIFWMPVDRSFTIKGHGTVVTGSILSGTIKPGDSLELLPAKRVLRVRGLQSHGQSASRAGLGERAALNLMNIAKTDIQRGDVLATPDYFEPSTLFDAKLYLLPTAPKALGNRARIRLHIGTREVMSRLKLLGCDKIEPGGDAFVQIMCEDIAVAQKRDPFVIRQYSPQLTIGGGVILDANPAPHRRSDAAVLQKLASLEKFDPVEVVATIILQHKSKPIKVEDICKESGLDAPKVIKCIDELISKQAVVQISTKPTLIHRQNYELLTTAVMDVLRNFHAANPLRPGISRANLMSQSGIKTAQLFDHILRRLGEEGHISESNALIKSTDHEIKLSAEDEKTAQLILDLLEEAAFVTPPARVLAEQVGKPKEHIDKILGALIGLGKIIRFEGDIHITSQNVEKAKSLLEEFARKRKEISVGEFRELLGTTRKYAMPILVYFDEAGLTTRVGDVRQINLE